MGVLANLLRGGFRQRRCRQSSRNEPPTVSVSGNAVARHRTEVPAFRKGHGHNWEGTMTAKRGVWRTCLGVWAGSSSSGEGSFALRTLSLKKSAAR